MNTTPEDAARIITISGFAFAGQKLTIQAMDPDHKYTEEKQELSEEAKETFAKIKGVLEGLYRPDAKLLDLTALGQNEQLINMGFFQETHTVSKLFPAMMVVCNQIFTKPEDKEEYVPSVLLASNAISNVSMVSDLAETFPDLQNLDLSHNQIQDLRGLDVWRHKFRKLEHLRLNGNPITDVVPSDYKEKLMEWYPRLRFLNDVEIRSPGEIALAIDQTKAAENITPIPIGDWDFRDVGSGMILVLYICLE